MRIVIKYPTRGRPGQFITVLNRYIAFLSGKHEVHFVISYDGDDASMNNPAMQSMIESLNANFDGRIHAYCGNSTGKIAAVNADQTAAILLTRPEWSQAVAARWAVTLAGLPASARADGGE